MIRNNPVFSRKFVKGMVIYAVVFLTIAAFGLSYFWKFIEAYELSRPKNTVNQYMDQLTAERMCSGSDDLYGQIDQNLQDREQFDRVIRDSLAENLTCAKKGSESTEDRQVYVIRSGQQVVGQFAITAGEEDRFGFRTWRVSDESFDFSHLMEEPADITVAADYRVSANGVLLDSSYITAQEIHYPALEEFYDDFDLPQLVTYTAGSVLGPVRLDVSDANGNAVILGEDTDVNEMLPVCGQEAADAVTDFSKAFIQKWVAFSASTKTSKTYNYYLVKYDLSSDGVLAERLVSALDGFNYAQSKSDTLQEVTVNRITPVLTDSYICDITYTVSTMGRQGTVDTTSNIKLMIVTENGSLKVKTMERY